MEGFKKLKECLQEAGLQHVHIGMKNIFRDTQLKKLTDVTQIKLISKEEQQRLDAEAAAEEAQRPASNEKAGAKGKPGTANQSQLS